MSAQTIRHRPAMARLATAPTAEQRAAFARDFANRHPESAATRFELERADRIEAQLQADLLLARIRADGEVGCDVSTERPLTVREVIDVNATGLLVIATMLAFGLLTAPYLAPVLARLWKVLP